jgi:ribonuclease VapC
VSLVIDTSALMSIVLGEPTAQRLAELLAACDEAIISAVTLVETTIVAEARLGPAGAMLVQSVLREANIRTVDVSAATAVDAVEGWRSYGKGRHRASLNLGDCFTYALARRRRIPILCVGDDFVHTDASVEPR